MRVLNRALLGTDIFNYALNFIIISFDHSDVAARVGYAAAYRQIAPSPVTLSFEKPFTAANWREYRVFCTVTILQHTHTHTTLSTLVRTSLAGRARSTHTIQTCSIKRN